jgi:hypothetical protein
MKKKQIELTAEDWRRADESLAKDPREAFRERFARHEAEKRIALEDHERRRQRLNRLSLGLLGRH